MKPYKPTLAALVAVMLAGSLGAPVETDVQLDVDGEPVKAELFDLSLFNGIPEGMVLVVNPPTGPNADAIIAGCRGQEEIPVTACLHQHAGVLHYADASEFIREATIDEFHAVSASPSIHPASAPAAVANEVDAYVYPNLFAIDDDIDCCNNKDAEGYMMYEWTDSFGRSIRAYGGECTPQGAQAGTCPLRVIGGSNGHEFVPLSTDSDCKGIKYAVEFWDEDLSSDDRMDISPKRGDAVASIEAAVFPTTSNDPDCSLEKQLRWWSEYGNNDSPAEWRCDGADIANRPGIEQGRFCPLTGQYDGPGDNDDATLFFTTFVIDLTNRLL